MYTKVNFAVYGHALIIVDVDGEAFSMIVLMFQWLDCSGNLYMNIIKNIDVINEFLYSFIGQLVADEVYIHILCCSADVTSQTAHNDTTFYGDMAT